MISKRTESLRPIVRSVIGEKASCDGWEDIVLAIIQHESAGIIGRPGKTPTGSQGPIPSKTSGMNFLTIAAGLMQTVWSTIATYAKSVGKTIFWEDIFGNSSADAKKQIQIGWFYLNRCIENVSKTMPNLEKSSKNFDFCFFVAMSYSVGFGKVESALKEHSEIKTAEDFKKIYPKFCEPKNRPIHYAENIISSAKSIKNDTPCADLFSFWPLAIAIASIWLLLKR